MTRNTTGRVLTRPQALELAREAAQEMPSQEWRAGAIRRSIRKEICFFPTLTREGVVIICKLGHWEATSLHWTSGPAGSPREALMHLTNHIQEEAEGMLDQVARLRADLVDM